MISFALVARETEETRLERRVQRSIEKKERGILGTGLNCRSVKLRRPTELLRHGGFRELCFK